MCCMCSINESDISHNVWTGSWVRPILDAKPGVQLPSHLIRLCHSFGFWHHLLQHGTSGTNVWVELQLMLYFVSSQQSLLQLRCSWCSIFQILDSIVEDCWFWSSSQPFARLWGTAEMSSTKSEAQWQVMQYFDAGSDTMTMAFLISYIWLWTYWSPIYVKTTTVLNIQLAILSNNNTDNNCMTLVFTRHCVYRWSVCVLWAGLPWYCIEGVQTTGIRGCWCPTWTSAVIL